MTLMTMRTIRRWLKRLLVGTGILCAVSGAALALIWRLYPFPVERLEKWSASPAILDAQGNTLFALVGDHEQWCHPVSLSEVSPWLIQATVAVEDERFYRHRGVDPLAVIRATGQNLASRRIVSGASTLNMQLCRMMGERPRCLRAKIVESFRALQLNRLMSKDRILELYLNTAPYGGNLRGVEAASLRYFSRRAKDLSLGQAALIAGLPQSPSRYNPVRDLPRALKRRRVVLDRMAELGIITEHQREQALSSHIEVENTTISQHATHAAWFALNRRPEGGRTTISLHIQQQVERLAKEHLQRLPDGTEVAVVVIDIAQSAIVSMLGSGDIGDPVDGQINGAMARRSPGSTLKPFIYAAAFETGRADCDSIVYDIPISRGGWTPANFDRTFEGEVTVTEALCRSLNVPAILVAEAIGLPRCCGTLEAVGISLPSDAEQRGGLALVVGGIEVCLLDVTNAYATLGREGWRTKPRVFQDEDPSGARALTTNVCRAINNILSSHNRRPTGMEYILQEDIPWFAWKTGTSAGRRDAWAVGHNGRYAIGVWVGRFRGTGRREYVGAQAAEPLLAKLFDLPWLRTSTVHPRHDPILVSNPLPRPTELREGPRITTPANGDKFVCFNGPVEVRAEADCGHDLLWFLNEHFISADQAPRLTLCPGHYELRCVNSVGRNSSVSFSVISPHSNDAQSGDVD